MNGLRRLPIVIGGFEAQAIAVALERMSPSRPLTHDLMKNFMMAFNVELHEVVINDLQEGIFYSKLVCSSQNDTVEIDSRTSDALALAVRFGCSIFTYDNILDSAGILMENDDKKSHHFLGNKSLLCHCLHRYTDHGLGLAGLAYRVSYYECCFGINAFTCFSISACG